MSIRTIAIFGTGLIGASVGLALKTHGFEGVILGWDKDESQARIAFERGAISLIAEDPLQAAQAADVVLLAGPVFSILEWIDRLALMLAPHQLLTDVGSVKQPMLERARDKYGAADQATYLAGHPMAGKEVFGAAHADAALFENAVWLFTPDEHAKAHRLEAGWRGWIEKIGARPLNLEAARHDQLCAWVSHLPQLLATALSALYEDTFGDAEDLRAIGGRALREMTRLGASPYSMWRDVAFTNADAIAACMAALEQRLAHVREHLKTPELRDEFTLANAFRAAAKRD